MGGKLYGRQKPALQEFQDPNPDNGKDGRRVNSRLILHPPPPPLLRLQLSLQDPETGNEQVNLSIDVRIGSKYR